MLLRYVQGLHGKKSSFHTRVLADQINGFHETPIALRCDRLPAWQSKNEYVTEWYGYCSRNKNDCYRLKKFANRKSTTKLIYVKRMVKYHSTWDENSWNVPFDFDINVFIVCQQKYDGLIRETLTTSNSFEKRTKRNSFSSNNVLSLLD